MRSEDEALRIGPNAFIHIRDTQGGFVWAEPLATSIEQSRREKLDAEEAMDVIAAAYLSKPSDRQAAATTMIQVLELESSLGAFAEQFGEGVTKALRSHELFLGGLTEGQIRFSGDVVKETGKDSNMLMAISQLGERRQLSQRSLLEVLKAQNFLGEDFDIEAEAKELNDDGQLLRSLIELAITDAITKRELIELLKTHRFLPETFDVDASISATGEDVRIAAVGAVRSQPTPKNEFIPPPG
jgi:hypothetical protein